MIEYAWTNKLWGNLSLISNKHDLIKFQEKHNNKNHNKIYGWISGNNEII